MSNDQPDTVAPRLSEEEISEIHRQVRAGYHPGATRELLTELDATRAELARTRAEAAALRTERDDARRWAVRLEQRLAAETAAAYRLLLANAPPWFAASQSEPPQPAAPVERSASVDHPYRPTQDNDLNTLCSKPSPYGGWAWCYLAPEQHATTPPDHQAGDRSND